MTTAENKQLLLNYLVQHNGKPSNVLWSELAITFNIAPDVTEMHKRSTSACDYWRAYCRNTGQTYKLLEPVMEKLDSQGNITSTTLKVIPDNVEIDTNKFEISKITKNPYGGQWITYDKTKEVFDKEEFLDKIKEIVSSTSVYVPSTNPYTTPIKEALMVYISDKHVGAKTEPNSLYPNEYNKTIIEERNAILLDFITEEAVLHEGFDEVVIFDLGDSQDGLNNKTTRGTVLNQNMNNKEQHLTYFETQKKFFDTLITEINPANNYTFIACANSNHGGDFDFMSMNTLKVYLNCVYPQVNVILVEEFISHYIYGDHCIIFSHGKDKEYMKHGMPLVIDAKALSLIDPYIRFHKLENYNITFVKGDLHQSATTFATNNRIRYKSVMSFYGSSDFVQTNHAANLSGVDIDIIRKDENKYYETRLQFDK